MRNTKYSRALTGYLSRVGHATNTDILHELQQKFPDLSATTVHRCTARLAEAGVIAEAPNDMHGNKQYDFNTEPHHHFYCRCCSRLRDIPIDSQVITLLEKQLNGCKLDDSLLISGSCKKCIQQGDNS